jgi:hypothetical protein
MFPSSSAITYGTSLVDAGGGMGAGATILVDVDVGMYAGVGRCIDGADAAMDAAAACVAMTSLPMRSRYISSHTPR